VNILLTGATGFIGSHVARVLVQEGHEVHALARPRSDLRRIADIQSSLQIIYADLLDSALRPPPCALCIHLAWYVEPGKYLESPENKHWLAASLRLARALASAGCKRFVAAGTCFEYATTNNPLRESSPTEPRTLYAQSKLELFNALQSLDMEIGWVRFFYQYGPFEDPRRLMPYVINSLLRGETCKLTPGEQVRDYLNVEDVATAVWAVAHSKLTGAVNIGSAQAVAVREVALKIGEHIGRPELIALGAQPYPAGDAMFLLADNSKLLTTGWRGRISLDDGLRATIEWWRQARPRS
jgi:nucleoside-diphosphate-sugar epimerase